MTSETTVSFERESSLVNVNLDLPQTPGRLESYIADIERNFEQTLSRVREKIDIADIDVVVRDNPRRTIPEIGIGGRVVNTHRIDIDFDPEFEHFTEVINKQFPGLLAHEWHHCLRFRKLGLFRNLLQAMVHEGLADHFSCEITGLDPQPWDKALNPKQIRKFGKRALKECRNEKYNNDDHNAWFFGCSQRRFSRKAKIPRWAGYTLGYTVIEEYLKRNPGVEVSELYDVDAEEFYDCLEAIVKDSQNIKK